MEFNAPAAKGKYREIARAMGVNVDGMTDDEAAVAACKAVKNLAIEVGIPQHLSELGIGADDIDRLALQAFEDVCTPGNPRDASLDEIKALYTALL